MLLAVSCWPIAVSKKEPRAFATLQQANANRFMNFCNLKTVLIKEYTVPTLIVKQKGRHRPTPTVFNS